MSNPAITPTAPQWGGIGSGLLTCTVNPFSAGDLLVLQFYANGSPATAVSGGGVTRWACASSYFDTSATFGVIAYASIWWGVVTTPGLSVITVTNTGIGGNYGILWAREFTAIGANWSVVTQDPAPGTVDGLPATSGTTVTYPTLAPSAGGNDLYIGAAWSYFGKLNAGSTPGFLYTAAGGNGNNQACYNPSVSAAIAPASTSTITGTWLAIAAMFTAGGGLVSSPAYATSNNIISGGAGTWVNPGNAEGPPSGSFATWTAP